MGAVKTTLFLISKAGRYGGTYAHKDIAFEFASWINPTFKLYLIKEFQRLKEAENNEYNLEGIEYSNEADILNIAVFGHTAKQWKDVNPSGVLEKSKQASELVSFPLRVANIDSGRRDIGDIVLAKIYHK